MDVRTEVAAHPRRRPILAVLCLSLLIVVIDNTILNTALPTLAESLRASTTDLQWITDAYTLVFGALLIVAGSLGDRYGRRGALLLGLCEEFIVGYTASSWRDAVAFGFLIVVLLFRPEGLFGRVQAEKV